MSAAAVTAVRAGLRVAFSRARRPLTPAKRCIGAPITQASGRTSCGLQQRDAEEHDDRAAAERRRGAAARRAAEEPVRQDGGADDAQQRGDGDPTAAAARLGGQALAQRDDRRDPRRPQRGDEARQHGHEHADDERDDDRARRDDRRRRRQVGADGLHQPAQAGGEQQPAEQPEQRGDQADQAGFEHDRAQHLAAARAQRAQQRQLAGALRDGDRERVVDDEGADEERDAAEDEQRGADEAEGLLEVGRLLGGVLGPGAHLDALAAQGDGDTGAQLGRRHAGVAGDRDRVQLAAPAGQRLRGGQRDDRRRVAGDGVDVAERRAADEPEALGAFVADGGDRVAELQALLRERLGRERQLAGGARRAAGHEGEGVQRLGLVGEDERRVAADLVALGVAQRELVLHAAGGGGDARRRRARVAAARPASGAGSLKKSSSTLLGATTTSVPWLACAKTSENDLLIVSVRTYVPEIIATPSTTDIAVRTVRSGRARRPRSATFLMATRPGRGRPR